MTIKLATFKSSLRHSNDFNEQQHEFITAIEKQLNESFIFSSLEDYDCDLKLIFVQTGGAEGYFLEAMPKLCPPYYLLTNGSNNSLAASLEILTFLKNHQLEGEIIHGDISYIASRIKQLVLLEQAKKKLSNMRLGVIGKPSDWLIASTIDFNAAHQLFGIEFVDIALKELEGQALKPHFHSKKIEVSFDSKETSKALDIYEGLKEIVLKHHLNGLTLRCFDLLTSLKMTGCLALAYLNSEHIVSSCEGDMMALLSMCVIEAVSGKASFQANPSRIDVQKNEVVLAHCTLPLNMALDYKLETHFESGIGVAVKGELKNEEVTIFRISADLKHYYLTTGRIIQNLNDSHLCRTQIVVHLDNDVKVLLNHPCGNHHIVCYGDEVANIERLMTSYGLIRVL
ncbi:MAG: hypothetical protein K2H02_00210 [Anaeroplasmataceae bacterium]|nr:hypothetical protein [Anaeroplasmataceae bacterium]